MRTRYFALPTVAIVVSCFAVSMSGNLARSQKDMTEAQSKLNKAQTELADAIKFAVAPVPKTLLDTAPDREVRLPKDELAPQEMVVITAEAGDVRDWGIDFIGTPEAWKLTKGKGVKVAVLDTGCDTGHRDLGRVKILKDFTGSRSGYADVNGHGSHCLGVVGAAENNVGMIGVAPECELLSGKVLGDNGSGLSSWIALGIDWAVAEGADVISMSLGSDAPDPRIEAAIKRARAKGIIVIAAAGNSGPRENSAGWPGNFDGVICVAAVDQNGKVAQFSSRGKSVVVAAPGVNVRSCYPGDRFAMMSGTSMATPYVAGCAALYISRCKELSIQWSAEEFAKLIGATSADIPPVGRDTASGFGLIQPVKLLPAKPAPKDPPKLPPDTDTIEITPPAELPLTAGGRESETDYPRTRTGETVTDSVRILQGDCVEQMRTLPDACVQTCVTSPPYYGLRDYGCAGQIGLEQSPAEYVAKLVEVFREVRRVLRDDDTLWLNLGDSYASGEVGRHDGYNAGASSKMPPREKGERQRFKGSAVSNLSDSVHAVLKGSTLFTGETYPRTAPAERLNVFVYDKRSPDRVLVPLLGVKRVLVKERDNNLCEIGGALNSPVRCYLSRSLLRRLPADTNAEGVFNPVEELSVVVAAGDLGADPALSPATVTLAVKGGEAPFAIEVTGEPVAESVVNVQPVGDTLSLNADAERGCKIDLVNESVALADGLHPSARGLRDFRVRKASAEQLQLSLVGGRIELAFLAVSHVFALSSGGVCRYGELYDKAHRLCNLNRPKQELGIPFRVRQALIEDGWLCRQTIIWHKPNPMPESVRDRCTKAHEYVFLLAKRDRYYYDADAVKENAATAGKINLGFSPKRAASMGRKASGNELTGGRLLVRSAHRNRRSVWTITPRPFKGAHFAVMPPELVRPCIRAGSKPGDIVIDPFGGSGTVAMVAIEEGRKAILCELNPEYVEIACNLIAGTNIPTEQPHLFSELEAVN